MASLHLAQQILDIIWPVGSLYFCDKATNPNTKFGGTWVQLKGGFLYGSNAVNGANAYSTGNGTGTVTNSHTLTINQIPKHQHYIHGYFNVNYPNYQIVTGQGGAELAASWDSGGTNQHHTNFVGETQGHSHNIPYIACSIWRRTA